MKQQLLIGVTGGIAAGKTTVCRMFGRLGAAVIDADQVGRNLLAAGAPLLGQVVEEFGKQILETNGELNRRQLGEIIFTDPTARAKLEAITHPAIAAAASEQVRKCWADGQTKVVYEAALLIETGRYQDMDALVVVVAEDEERIARLIKRNNLTREQARQRLAAQMPQAEKEKYADFLVDTSGSFEDTFAQVRMVWSALDEKK